MTKLRIGTSGWSYTEWRGEFYPRGLPQDRRLAYYAERFKTVELNATFYRWPPPGQFARWASATPDDFVFSVKAPRSITHLKRLRDCDGDLRAIATAAAPLGNKLGQFLYQLPPALHADAALLEDFVASLPALAPHVVEFRHASWFSDRVLDILRAGRVTLCISDFPEAEAPQVLTSSRAYVRLHGGRRYSEAYNEAPLRSWARMLAGWRDQGIDGFVYFNNTAKGHAIRNAMRLRALLAQDPAAARARRSD